MLSKQAKILTKSQVTAVHAYLGNTRNSLRNQTIFLLSVKAGLRAKEIANLKWDMLLNATGQMEDCMRLMDSASKGSSGRIIPLNALLKKHLIELLQDNEQKNGFDRATSFVICTERSSNASPQAIVNMFSGWYREIGLVGCSSHSGRRTFITNAARKIGTVGGSLRDVQALAGHSSLGVTQRYIEGNNEARMKIVEVI